MEQALDAQDFRTLARQSWDQLFAAAYPQLLSLFQNTEQVVEAQSQESLREIEGTREKVDLQASRLNTTILTAQGLVDAQTRFNETLGEVLKETGNMQSSPLATAAKVVGGAAGLGAAAILGNSMLSGSKPQGSSEESQSESSPAPSSGGATTKQATPEKTNQGGAPPPVTAPEDKRSAIQRRGDELLNPRTSRQQASPEKPQTTSRTDGAKTEPRPVGEKSPNFILYSNQVYLDKVNPTLVTRLGQAADEYNKITGKKVGISSGWRSAEHQARLYASRGSNQYPVARPGTSNHEKGLAIDIEPATADYLDRTGILAKYGLGRPVMKSKGASRDDSVHIEMAGGTLEPQEKPGAKKDADPSGQPAGATPIETPAPPQPPAGSPQVSENESGKTLQDQSQRKVASDMSQASQPPRSQLTQVAGIQTQEQDNKKPADRIDSSSPRDRLSQVFSSVA
jgi:LAS superfamily LD-carboxypeptidase LdcB